MPRNKRLHFKDINALRGIAFFPIFLYCILILINPEEAGLLQDISGILGRIVQGSVDFFFLLSAFLITSHALREYKYTEKFSYKNFLVRRTLRLGAVLVLGLTFAFFLHPWLVRVLDLHPIVLPDVDHYLAFIPNYLANVTQQVSYLTVLCVIFMFIQFYLIWGLVLRYLRKYLVIISGIVVLIGIISRAIHLANDSSYIMDTLAYGISIGIGSFAAIIVREENSLFEKIKALPKNVNWVIYSIGVLILISGYLITGNSYISILIPILIALFGGYVILEQTFGKNSIVQLKSKKILSYLGKISYGMIVYQSIIGVLLMIAAESLDFDLTSSYTIIIMLLAGFIGSIIVADISYKLFEKPLIRIRREFKKA